MIRFINAFISLVEGVARNPALAPRPSMIYCASSSRLITFYYKNPQSIYCRGLAPFSLSFYDSGSINSILFGSVPLCTPSRQTHRKYKYVNHIENTVFSIFVFIARCIAAEVIRLLHEYSSSSFVVGFTKQRDI
jgi:hypothetical protein